MLGRFLCDTFSFSPFIAASSGCSMNLTPAFFNSTLDSSSAMPFSFLGIHSRCGLCLKQESNHSAIDGGASGLTGSQHPSMGFEGLHDALAARRPCATQPGASQVTCIMRRRGTKPRWRRRLCRGMSGPAADFVQPLAEMRFDLVDQAREILQEVLGATVRPQQGHRRVQTGERERVTPGACKIPGCSAWSAIVLTWSRVTGLSAATRT